MISLLLIILIVAALYIIIKKYNPIRLSSRKHFAVIIGYMVFLLVVLITAEIIGRTHQPSSSTVDFAEFYNDINTGEINKVIDSPQFTEKRTHPIGDKLTIQNEYDGAHLFVERRSNYEGIIEELIFKPMLIVNGQYDFSDKVHMTRPIWQNDLMSIPEQPTTVIRYALFYDTVLLKQMTTSRHTSGGYSYAADQPTVYLIVPEDVEIEVSARSSIHYIEE